MLKSWANNSDYTSPYLNIEAYVKPPNTFSLKVSVPSIIVKSITMRFGIQRVAALLLLLANSISWASPIVAGDGSSTAVATATAVSNGFGGVASSTATATASASSSGSSGYDSYYPVSYPQTAVSYPTVVQQVPVVQSVSYVQPVQQVPVISAPSAVGGLGFIGGFGGAGFGGGFNRYRESYSYRARGFGGGLGHGGFGGRYKVRYASGGAGGFAGLGGVIGGGAIIG